MGLSCGRPATPRLGDNHRSALVRSGIAYGHQGLAQMRPVIVPLAELRSADPRRLHPAGAMLRWPYVGAKSFALMTLLRRLTARSTTKRDTYTSGSSFGAAPLRRRADASPSWSRPVAVAFHPVSPSALGTHGSALSGRCAGTTSTIARDGRRTASPTKMTSPVRSTGTMSNKPPRWSGKVARTRPRSL
jgi:hypothetical protein